MEKFYLQLLIENGDAADLDTVDDLEGTIRQLRKDLATSGLRIGRDAERLHREIAEGRRDEAIAILGEATGTRFYSIREMRNLFGDRIP